jgi:CO/xanthine dehydrogenase Mo-binding subunit
MDQIQRFLFLRAVGAQGIEVELDKRDYTYRITKAYSVVDIGTVLNDTWPLAAFSFSTVPISTTE